MMNKINYLFGFTLTVLTHTSYALPTAGKVISGDAGISISGNNMNINQASHKAIIDWRGFDIAKNERVDFYQPNTNSITLNRITGGDISHINGQLNANGRLFLVNSNGIIFGKNSQVNVSGLLATTSQITNNDFNAGNYKFSNTNPNAKIINNGNISIKDAGFASLVAPSVQNNGIITARLGKVVLGSADAFTLDMYGDGLIQFDVSKQVKNGFVGNSGKILANGGLVHLSTQAVAGVVGEVINVSGIIEAKIAEFKDGVITLSGGNSGQVLVSGELNAKKVKVLGDKVGLLSGAKINTGGAGEVLIGGNFQGKGLEQNAQYTYVDKNVSINADGINSDGGRVIIWADKNTQFYGEISAKGAEGKNGGFTEVSGKENLVFRGKVDLTSKNGNKGTLLLDPKNIIIADGGADVVADNDIFSESPALDATFDADLIVTALDGANLILQANNDITVNEAIDSSAGGVGDLSLVAGRSITLNEGIKLNGNFVAIVNSDSAIAANRDAGDASFILGSGKSIDTSTGNKDINIGYADGANGNDATGAMSIVGSLNAGSGDIFLDTSANDGGAASFENVAIDGSVVAGDFDITGNQFSADLMTLSSDLTLIAKDDVFQTDAWSVANLTTLNAVGKNIVLDNVNNDFADDVMITANDVILKDKNILRIGASNISGNVVINAGGMVDDDGSITANGIGKSFEVNSTGAVSLGTHNNNFTTIKGSSGAGALFNVRDVDNLDIGTLSAGGDVFIQTLTTGNITQSGDISIATGNTFKATSNGNITLDRTNNDFSTIKLRGRNVVITDANGIDIGQSSISNGTLITAGGDVTNSGAISQSNSDTIFEVNAGSNNITLDNVANDFAVVKLTANDAALTDATAIIFGDTTIAGNATINAGGGVDDNGTIIANGINKTFQINNAGQDVELDSSGNDFTDIGFNSFNVILTDIDDVDIMDSNITGNTTINAGGDVSGRVINATGEFSVNAAGQDVHFSNANDFNILKINAKDAYITDTNNLVLGETNITGDIEFSSIGGNLTQKSTSTERLSIDGKTTINAGGNVVLNNTQNTQKFGGVVEVNAKNVEISSGNQSDFAIQGNITGNLEIDSEGNISDSGNLIIAGTANFIEEANNKTITLNTLQATGKVTVSAHNAIIDNGSVDLFLGGMVTNNLDLKSTGNIKTGNFLSSLAQVNIDGGTVEVANDMNVSGTIDIKGDATLNANLVSNGDIALKNVSFSGGAKTINSNGGDITFTKITGTDDSRLRLLAAGENAVTSTGGTINGEVDINELFISGSGGALTGSLRSVNPSNGRKAAESIGTSPVPHGGNFTFNGYRVTGKEIEGESKRRFVALVTPKIASNANDLLFVMSNDLSKYTPDNLDISSSGVDLFSNSKEEEEK